MCIHQVNALRVWVGGGVQFDSCSSGCEANWSERRLVWHEGRSIRQSRIASLLRQIEVRDGEWEGDAASL